MTKKLKVTWVITLGLLLAVASTVCATQVLFTDFEGFKVNASINGQNGWAVLNPAYDQEVVSFNGHTVWRLSDYFVSGNFSDQPFAPRLGGIPSPSNPTNGSPGAFAGETSTGTSLKHFEASFRFRSAVGKTQPGARVTVSADDGEGGRQSFIAIEDGGSGVQVTTFDVDSSSGKFIGPIVIASGLSYTEWHTTRVEIEFKDGPNNDVVKYFVDGLLVHIGPSWEQCYRNDPGDCGSHLLGVPVQTLLFRLGSASDTNPGVPCLSCLHGGYFIDDVAISVGNEHKGDGEDEEQGHRDF